MLFPRRRPALRGKNRRLFRPRQPEQFLPAPPFLAAQIRDAADQHQRRRAFSPAAARPARSAPWRTAGCCSTTPAASTPRIALAGMCRLKSTTECTASASNPADAPRKKAKRLLMPRAKIIFRARGHISTFSATGGTERHHAREHDDSAGRAPIGQQVQVIIVRAVGTAVWTRSGRYSRKR